MGTDDSAIVYDAFAEDLQRLRISAGNVSYSAIAERVAAAREARGANASAARVARSTVYDAFQPGRRRVDADLIADIALALGESDAEAAGWRARSLERHLVDRGEPTPNGPDPLIPRLRAALIVAIMAAAVFMNLFGGTIAVKLQLPLFLDMAGTALVAFVFGPWHAVAVAVATNTLGAITSSPETIVFALVNVVGALIWGYGMRRYGRTWGRLLLLTVAVALVCTLVSVPLNVLMYSGMGHASNAYVIAMEAASGIVPAVFSVGFLVSIVDKVIATLVAVILARWVARLELVPRAPWRAAPRV